MSVTLRGKKFHFRFQISGTDYHGVCDGCTVSENASPKEIAVARAKALRYEEGERARVRAELAEQKSIEADIRKNRTVRALVENYRYELTGGAPLPLADAIAVAEAKPAAKNAGERFVGQRRTYWRDFTAYMAATYPDITDIAQVRRAHCETFVRHLIDHGRFCKDIQYDLQKGKRTKRVSYTVDRGLAPKTIKAIVSVCSWVFTKVSRKCSKAITSISAPRPRRLGTVWPAAARGRIRSGKAACRLRCRRCPNIWKSGTSSGAVPRCNRGRYDFIGHFRENVP